MSNHDSAGQISTDFDLEADQIKCMAFRAFKAGEQFKIYYGDRNNHDMLVHNGFVAAENAANALQVKLGISKNDALASAKYDLLSRLVISPQGHFQVGRDPEKPLDQPTLAFLRVMCLSTQEEIDLWGSEDKIRGLLDEQLEGEDKELDLKAYKYISTRCTLLLRSYPTSIEDDEKALKNVDLPLTLQYCARLRKAEKQILEKVIEFCKRKV